MHKENPDREKSIRKQQMLAVFDRFVEENGYAPTVRELLELSPVKSTAVIHSYIHELIQEGVLENKAKSPRTLRRVRKDGEDI